LSLIVVLLSSTDGSLGGKRRQARRSTGRASEGRGPGRTGTANALERGLAARPDREEDAEDEGRQGEGKGQEEDGQDDERDGQPREHLFSPFSLILSNRGGQTEGVKPTFFRKK
jgi:hypothetical protein